MKERQAGFRIRLDGHSGVPFYRQIIDYVRGGMASGALQTGEQLPTVRQLAVDLAINPNTVVRAYRELELGGCLESNQGSGTFIRALEIEGGKRERARQLAQIVSDCLARAGAVGFSIQEVIEGMREIAR